MTPLGALYRGRNWVGAIPPKIWEKRPAVGSPSHRRMWGTKHCLEHLMRRCGLRSARMVIGHTKWHFHVWKSKKRVKLVCLSQNPISLLKKKKKFWRAITGHKNSNKVPMPHVIFVVDEPIVVSRRPHTRTMRPCQWHIARGGPTVEKELWRESHPWHD